MKVIVFFKLLRDSLLNKKLVIFLLLLMSSISVYMIDNIGTKFYSKEYSINSYSSMFKINPSEINYVKYLNYDDPDYSSQLGLDIIEYIRQQDGVRACGRFSTQNHLDNGKEIKTIIIEKDIIDIGNLKFNENELITIKESSGNFVYVGCELKDKFKIGDEFYFYSDDNNTKCVVMGNLKKGAAWPKKGSLSGGVSNTDTYNLNESIVVVTDSYDSFAFTGGMPDMPYFIVRGSDKAEGVSSLVTKYAADNNVGVKIVNLRDEIDRELQKNNVTRDNTFYAGVLLFVLALLSMSAASIVFCLISKQQFGIMIACGISKGQIILINFFTNMIIVFIPQICIWMIRQREIFGSVFYVYPEEMNMITYPYYYAHCIVMPVIYLITLVVVTICAGVIPSVIIGRMRVADVIKPVN